MIRYFSSSSLEVLVASYGGVGTTFLSEEIARYRKVNDPRDLDGLKHCPVPPLFGSKNLKVIYVVGNPILAVASLFRRGFHVDQAGKLQYSKFRREFPDKKLKLEDYAKGGVDLFLFEEHFQAWTETHVFYPTLVVKCESIHDSLSRIGEFLNLPPKFVSNFPPSKERRSSFDKIAPEAMQNLKHLYGSLEKKIESLSMTTVLIPKMQQSVAFTDRRYWIGAVRDAFWSTCHQLLRYSSREDNDSNNGNIR